MSHNLKGRKSRNAGSQSASERNRAPATVPPPLPPVYLALQGGQPPLQYAATADLRATATMAEETVRQVVALHASGCLARIGITSRSEAAWESPGSKARLNVKEIKKSLAAIKRQAPNSISQIVTATGASAIEGEAFAYFVRLETLVLDLGQSGHLLQAEPPPSRTQMEPLGPRPPVEPYWVESPNEEAVRCCVLRFLEGRQRLRAASAEVAKKLQLHPFRKEATTRRLGIAQMDLLLPLNQSFFGAGVGETILKIAMTAPLQQAKSAKKVEGSISRDELVDLLWSDTLANGRNKPPFINL